MPVFSTSLQSGQTSHGTIARSMMPTFRQTAFRRPKKQTLAQRVWWRPSTTNPQQMEVYFYSPSTVQPAFCVCRSIILLAVPSISSAHFQPLMVWWPLSGSPAGHHEQHEHHTEVWPSYECVFKKNSHVGLVKCRWNGGSLPTNNCQQKLSTSSTRWWPFLILLIPLLCFPRCLFLASWMVFRCRVRCCHGDKRCNGYSVFIQTEGSNLVQALRPHDESFHLDKYFLGSDCLLPCSWSLHVQTNLTGYSWLILLYYFVVVISSASKTCKKWDQGREEVMEKRKGKKQKQKRNRQKECVCVVFWHCVDTLHYFFNLSFLFGPHTNHMIICVSGNSRLKNSRANWQKSFVQKSHKTTILKGCVCTSICLYMIVSV